MRGMYMDDKPDIVNETDDLIRISGCVEHIIFCNEENGYTVCDLGTDDDDIVTLTGIMPYINEGDQIIVYGEWRHTPKYGRQFWVSQYERNFLFNAVSILRYLSSGAIKGIGKKTAQKIVDEFGDNSLEVIENHPDWLSDIPGMSLNKAKQISEDFKEKAGIRTVMLFFREFFGASLTVKIYKKWGIASIDIAKSNPYRLCDEIDGIGFEKADRMAQKLGIGLASEERYMSGIIYVLSSCAAQSGHVCLPRGELIRETVSTLNADEDDISRVIDLMLGQKKLERFSHGGTDYIFDRFSYGNEKYIAQKLLLLDKVCPAISHADINIFIENEERKNGFSYALLQKKALISALECGVMLLTGGPGTGKTTVVKALLAIFRSMDMKVALAAPTGRAAKKLSEATAFEAKTIHRLLEYEYSPEEGDRAGFARNENNLLEEDALIIDEASMIDNTLMASLLKAVKPGARLIIIGDADQLPSVGAGNVLRDLLDSGRFSTVKLTQIFRQAEKSLIVTNAHLINNGQTPRLDIKDNDFFFLPRVSERDIMLTVTDLCKNRLPRTYGELAVNGTQVISPSRKGGIGTDNLNVMLQDALNPPEKKKKEHKIRDRVYREGDRVMQTKNNYELEWRRGGEIFGTGVFNGDIGIILKIDNLNQNMEILFDDRHVDYDFSMLDELDLAYAVTVHKSQGSEYPIVIFPLYSAPSVLLTRNLFYTAVTRAQKMVILVGKAEIAERMVSNNRLAQRYTCLKQRLED